jgi:hypothetical protein
LSFVLLTVAILTGVRYNLNVVLICIFFMARDSEYFFMCFVVVVVVVFYFLGFSVSSFEKALLSLFVHFSIGSLILGEFIFFLFPVYSGYQSLDRCVAGKYFLPFCE